MITKNILKNGKTSVTSTHFDDIRVLKASLAESMQEDYVATKWRKDKARDFNDLKLATCTQVMQLAKKGIAEINNFTEGLRPEQYKNYKINYGPWKPYESYEDLEAIRDKIIAKKVYGPLDEVDEKELARVQNEISNIDFFVNRQIEAVRTAKDEINA